MKTPPDVVALHPWFAEAGPFSAARLAYARGIARHWARRLAGVGGRVVDLIIGVSLLLVLGVVLLLAYLVSLFSGGGLSAEDRVGRDGNLFRLYCLDFGGRHAPRWLCRLPVLLNLLRGDVGLVGPRPLRPEEAPRRHPGFWTRSSVRPGVISLFWLRQRTNIAFRTELETDLEYAHHKTVRSDLGIALRAAPAALYGSESREVPSVVEILGVSIHNCCLNDAVGEILRRSTVGSAPAQVCFVNADCLNIAFRQPQYFQLLERAFLVLADGIGLKLAGRLLTRGIRQNVNGTDMFPLLCAGLAQAGRRLYLLGGRPGVPEAVAGWIQRHAPGLTICGIHHGYFAAQEEEAVIAEIAASEADVLLVALGAPRQDLWIARNLGRLHVPVAMGVGGLFDFYSRLIPRAPQWLRELGLEWVYRLLQEPRRMWRRYLVGNVLFLCRVGRERLGMRLPHHIAAKLSGGRT